jgi:PAS domain S-box-containing protein
MSKTSPIDDTELAAIAASGAIFSTLPDDARRRVLSYVLARYLPEAVPAAGLPALSPIPAGPQDSGASEGAERALQGIALLTEAGAFQLSLREFKAKSRLDAAVRLAVVAIHAHQLLTGRPLSSRGVLTPLLKEWRLYDGNTRSRLAREQGILRRGDDLSLNAQGVRDAERFVGDIRSTGDKRGRRFQRWGSAPETQQSVAPAEINVTSIFDHIENWANFTNKCSVGIHTVSKDGTILWANRTELDCLGYAPEEYIGRFIGDFHVDADDVHDILGILTRFETVENYPARMRAKDGSIKFVMINSNVYRQARGEFGHSRCFTTEIGEFMWRVLKDKNNVIEKDQESSVA